MSCCRPSARKPSTVLARQQAKLGLIFLDMNRSVSELEKLV